MTTQDLYDAVELRFPDMTPALFYEAVNLATSEIINGSLLLRETASVVTVKNQRFYALPDDCIQIDRIHLADEEIFPISPTLVDGAGNVVEPPVSEIPEWTGPIRVGGES
jgi:hypothetical protein